MLLVTNGTFLFYDNFFAFICKISLTVVNYSNTSRILAKKQPKKLFFLLLGIQLLSRIFG